MTFSHGYALLIGVGESTYPKLSLPVTVKDMQAVRDILADEAMENNTHLPDLINAQARAGNLRRNLFCLQKKSFLSSRWSGQAQRESQKRSFLALPGIV
jgi:hypothetical protein